MTVQLFWLGFTPKMTYFLSKRKKQCKDQRAVYGGEALHFEADKEKKINQNCLANIGHSKCNNLECAGKEINDWCTDQQMLKMLVKEKQQYLMMENP